MKECWRGIFDGCFLVWYRRGCKALQGSSHRYTTLDLTLRSPCLKKSNNGGLPFGKRRNLVGHWRAVFLGRYSSILHVLYYYHCLPSLGRAAYRVELTFGACHSTDWSPSCPGWLSRLFDLSFPFMMTRSFRKNKISAPWGRGDIKTRNPLFDWYLCCSVYVCCVVEPTNNGYLRLI